MVAAGIFLLSMGAPCLGLGLYLRRAPRPVKVKGKKKPGPPPNPTSWLGAGGVLVLAGGGLLAAGLLS